MQLLGTSVSHMSACSFQLKNAEEIETIEETVTG